MGFTIGPTFAKRLINVVRWVEQRTGGGSVPRGEQSNEDLFGRAQLSATLSQGGSATANRFVGSPALGWTLDQDKEITVYEDGMLADGEQVNSESIIHIKWMHGHWIFDDTQCANITDA